MLIFLFVLIANVGSQRFQLIDKETNAAVSDAYILSTQGLVVVSDLNGYFSLPDSIHHIQISHLNYEIGYF